jgi:hypothetical protein
MYYEQDRDKMSVSVYLIDDSPITYPIAEIPSKRASEPRDIRIFVGILAQVLKTTM